MAAGAAVSMVTASAGDGLLCPPPSDCVAVMLWTPSAIAARPLGGDRHRGARGRARADLDAVAEDADDAPAGDAADEELQRGSRGGVVAIRQSCRCCWRRCRWRPPDRCRWERPEAFRRNRARRSQARSSPPRCGFRRSRAGSRSGRQTPPPGPCSSRAPPGTGNWPLASVVVEASPDRADRCCCCRGRPRRLARPCSPVSRTPLALASRNFTPVSSPCPLIDWMTTSWLVVLLGSSL